MPQSYEVIPAREPIKATVRPPGSKSITNRALVCAALAKGQSRLEGALESDDTRVMVAGLQALGIRVEVLESGTLLVVDGTCGRIPASEAELFCDNSGTTIRFLASLVSLGHGAFRLDGSPRMRQRPVGDLLEALRQLGVDAVSEFGSGCPPILVRAEGLAGGTAAVRGDVSSQFLSGLLMAAPAASGLTQLHVEGPLVSRPYVELTLAVMRSFGVEVVADSALQSFQISPATYQPRSYVVEPDASAASYFWAAAAVTGGEITVHGLSRQSLQGDVGFVDALVQMGCEAYWESDRVTVVGRALRGVEIDMNEISDTVQTLAAVALFAEGPTTIRGVAHNRWKETDRIGNLALELRKLGATVAEHDDGLTITPGPLKPAEVDTYQDHRMAMSLALVGLRVPGVLVRDPDCTSKTYPGFFSELERLVADG